MELLKQQSKKFSSAKVTAKGEARAFVEADDFTTIWFNTGTLCNLECMGCYIESSPKNDKLVYISTSEVKPYLDEIQQENYSVAEIAFTGGEPFMNKQMLQILELCLSRGFEVLVLTNAMLPMQKKLSELIALKEDFGKKLKIRVSMDHYLEAMHAKERGEKAWEPALAGLKQLSEHDFQISVAGRTMWGESDSSMREGYEQLFKQHNIQLQAFDPSVLMLFPEMDEQVEVPEITTECWGILGKTPADVMCSNSRMIVKRKGADAPAVLACTLLAYDQQFELGHTLKESLKPIYLNHHHCAKFCVLGGASCSK